MKKTNVMSQSNWCLPTMNLPFKIENLRQVIVAIVALVVPSLVSANSEIGKLNVTWGDSELGVSAISYSLALDGGEQVLDLNISDEVVVQAGGIRNISGQSVVIETASGVARPSLEGSVSAPTVVTSITLLDTERPGAFGAQSNERAVAQNRRFVSIMCKFSNVPDEPQDLAFFSNMYGNAPGQLNHYWKEVTSNKINVAGSTAHGWYTLPRTRAYYTNLIAGSNHSPMLTAMFNDCTKVADADINFNTVFGINMMFNESFGSFAWGGSRYVTLDGVSKSFAATWEPPWGWANVTIMAHEMGHSFGLPHSNTSDQDNSPYDNPWTVMSDSWSYTKLDPAGIYGFMGQHINAYDKLELGTFSAAETFTHLGPFSTIVLDPQSDSAASSSAYRVAVIPVNSATIDYYTVEVRDNNAQTASLYEGLPGSGVIVHAVKNSRNEPAWLIDGDSPVSTNGDTAGVIWTAGEVFEDLQHGVRVAVDAKIGQSFQVSLGYPATGITSPNAGATLAGSRETFQWAAVSGATAYRVWLGSVAGGDEHGRFASNRTSLVASGLPTDGNAVYATLKWYDGTWHTESSVVYTASSSSNVPVITSPVAGSTFAGPTQTFQWSTASGASVYRVWMGSVPGGDEYGRYSSVNNSLTINGLPTDESAIYATLKWNDGSWHSEPAINYTAASIGSSFISPSAGSTISSGSQTFEWDARPGATTYRVWVGSTPGGDEFGRYASAGTSRAVTGLPTDGTTLYVSLRWNDGSWNTEADVNYSTGP